MIDEDNIQNYIRNAVSAEDFYNIFVFYKERRELNLAEVFLEKALEIDKENLQYKLILSVIALANGHYERGWEMYESRINLSSYQKRTLPLWRGDNNQPNRRIVVFSEQGYGDSFMYARFIYLLKNHFGYVCFCQSKELLRVLNKNVLQIDEVCSEIKPEDFDCYCDLASLPFLLQLNSESLLNNNWNYLYSERNIPKDTKIKAGLCLHGRLSTEYEKTRAVDLTTLNSIIHNRQIDFYSLYQPLIQNTIYNDWLRKGLLKEDKKIFSDFQLTADLINNLDFIITSDTSVAHLSGSLGKKTYLLLPKMTDWRWKISGKDSYWYDSITILRQEEQGNWENVSLMLAELIKKEFPDEKAKISLTDKFKHFFISSKNKY